MDARLALIRACAAYPTESTPRLVLADWYGDNPEFPGAAANEAFLRACWTKTTKKGERMPKKAYAVLKGRWLELIPSVVALSVPVTGPDHYDESEPVNGVRAKQLTATLFQMMVQLPGQKKDGATQMYSCRLVVGFRFGLANFWGMASEWGKKQVAPAMAIDRPELFLTPETT